MGRPKKALVNSTGHLNNDVKKQKELEEYLIKSNSDKIEAPSWLNNELAIEEFCKLANELKEIDIITNLDVNNLATYCQAYSKYVEATIELNNQTLTIRKTMPNGAINIVENPLINIQKKYAEEMRRFAGLCGLTIDSRLKFATVKVEKLNNELEEEFGEI